MEFKSKTTPWLLKRFAVITHGTVNTLRESAFILCELEKRKAVPAGISGAYLRYFREIAAGTLAPEILLHMGPCYALATIMRLPVKEQVKLADGGTVPVAVHDDKGNINISQKAPHTLTLGQWELAVGKDGFRTYAEQRRILSRRGPDVRRSGALRELRFDAATNEIICGQIRIAARDVIGLLARNGWHLAKNETEKARAA